MRHPFISIAAWSTVAAVTGAALGLGVIAESLPTRPDAQPRSLGMRALIAAAGEPHDAAVRHVLGTRSSLLAPTSGASTTPPTHTLAHPQTFVSSR